MTNEEEKKKQLLTFLGPEFTEADLEAALREEPELPEAVEALAPILRRANEGELPRISPDFTARVMDHLERPSLWRRVRVSWFSLPRLVMASAVAAALVVLVYGGWFREPNLGTPLSVREARGPEGQKVFFVRFSWRQSGVQKVAIAGDFNQWQPVSLSPSSEAEGLYTVEMPLTQGTYSYAFVVDGKRWVPDPAADRWVEDGFGQRNSVINL